MVRLSWCALLTLPLLLGSGCATPELWSRAAFFPASPPQIQLFEHNQEILVRYREASSESSSTELRAFYLFRNADRLKPGLRPAFARTAVIGRPVPIASASSSSTAASLPSKTGYSARLTESGPDFELFRDGVAVGRYSLPAYEAFYNPASMRIVLSPFTVALDVIGVCTIAWLEAGGPGLAAGCGGGGHSGGLVAIKH